jgi:hypothetical protein
MVGYLSLTRNPVIAFTRNQNDLGRFSQITFGYRAASRTLARGRRAMVGRQGDWKRAHESAQQDEGQEGSWVHAYLHRKEGDQDNAAYWYDRAGKPVCREPVEAEWLIIARSLITQAQYDPTHRSRQ